MKIAKTANAIETFNQLIESKLLDASKGYWYKALAYVKAGDKEQAKALLEKITSDSLYNHQKAEELLDKL